jgi:hypothetical protein
MIVNSRNYETAGDPEPDLTGCFGAKLSACYRDWYRRRRAKRCAQVRAFILASWDATCGFLT